MPLPRSCFPRSFPSHPNPLSFPPRRSSELFGRRRQQRRRLRDGGHDDGAAVGSGAAAALLASGERRDCQNKHECEQRRSEEHTSELQSPCNLVCRHLLEKKKTNYPTKLLEC